MTAPPRSSESQISELLPRPGADLHYALLYVPPCLRLPLALLESLRAEIARIPYHCASPEVAQTKLGWWREEAALLGTGRERHILTRAFAANVDGASPAGTALRVLATGVANLLTGSAHETSAARDAAFDAAHGALWAEHARLCGVSGTAQSDARRLGVTIEIACAVRDARLASTAGLAWTSIETVERSQAPAALPDTAAWHARVALAELPALRARLAADAQSFAPPARRAARSVRALARICAATAAEIEADGGRVWEHRTELTPVRKLWIAWRTRA